MKRTDSPSLFLALLPGLAVTLLLLWVLLACRHIAEHQPPASAVEPAAAAAPR